MIVELIREGARTSNSLAKIQINTPRSASVSKRYFGVLKLSATFKLEFNQSFRMKRALNDAHVLVLILPWRNKEWVINKLWIAMLWELSMQWHYATINGRICSYICFKKPPKKPKNGWNMKKTFLLSIKNFIHCAATNAEKFEIFRGNLFDLRTQMVHFSSELASKTSFKIKKIVIRYLYWDFFWNFSL